MTEMTLEHFVQHVQASVDSAQQEHILITRSGEPVAVLLGIEHKDEEDWRLELSPEFWRMIQERRQEQASTSLGKVESELLEEKIMEPIEIRDPSGRLLGHFTPSPQDAALYEKARALFDLEEAKRVAATEHSGYSIEEVKRYLQTLGNPA